MPNLREIPKWAMICMLITYFISSIMPAVVKQMDLRAARSDQAETALPPTQISITPPIQNPTLESNPSASPTCNANFARVIDPNKLGIPARANPSDESLAQTNLHDGEVFKVLGCNFNSDGSVWWWLDTNQGPRWVEGKFLELLNRNP